MNGLRNTIKNGVYHLNGEEMQFMYYTSLPAKKKVQFISIITSLLFTGDNYNSLLKDVAFKYAVIRTFTTADVSAISNKENNAIDEMENIVYNSDIIEIVKNDIDEELWKELEEAVELNIEYKTGIHRNPLMDNLASLFKTLEDRMKDVDLSKLDAVNELATSLKGQNVDYEKLAQAYMNTDLSRNLVEKREAEKQARTKRIDELAKTAKPKKSKKKKDAVVEVDFKQEETSTTNDKALESPVEE